MIDNIRKALTNNILWKLAALVLAIILWLIAVYIEDPITTNSYKVNLTVKNSESLSDNNLVLLNKDILTSTTINVRVKASRKILDNRLSSRNISAYIDMNDFYMLSANKIGEEVPAKIYYDLPYGLESEAEIQSVTPNTVNIVIDKYETRGFPVDVVIAKKPEGDYIAGEPVTNPETVYVSGAKSILDSIGSVGVSVNLEGSVEEFAQTANLVVLDKDSNDISEKVRLDRAEVLVTIPINKQGTIAVKPPEIIGYPLKGYIITEVTMDTDVIEVVGKSEEIEALDYINLDSISISGASYDQVFPRDVRDFLRDTNLQVKNNTPHVVNVTVKIEREIEKNIEFDMKNVEIIGDTKDIDLPSTVNIMIGGIESEIEKLNPNDIKASIDLTDLEDGIHNIRVNVELPTGITELGISEVTVKKGTIEEVPNIEEPEETDKDEDKKDDAEAEVGNKETDKVEAEDINKEKDNKKKIQSKNE